MIYLCHAKYKEKSYTNEGFRNEDKDCELIRIVQADTELEAIQKLASRLDLNICYGLDYHGRKGATEVHEIEISEMIL
jgi:hypothetical protein